MEEVKAEALRSNFVFTHPTVIHRIDRSQDTLKVYVSAGLSDCGCLVTFENPIGLGLSMNVTLWSIGLFVLPRQGGCSIFCAVGG